MSEDKTVATRNATPAERFTAMVIRQYAADVGHVEMSEYERTLLQHCFIKCDMAFAEARAKQDKNDLPIDWVNINMKKLAIDAAHRIKLGIDGLIPGHLYPIAYYNKNTKQYDVDLRVGYKGEIYYTQQASLRPIRDIRVELVYSTDEFVVYKKGASCKIEGYDFKVNNPFERGEVAGGFAYIEYMDDQSNVLICMGRAKFDERRKKAGSDKFWGPYFDEMCYKTLVHAAAKKVTLDPKKINVASLAQLEADEEIYPEDALQPLGNGAEIVLDEQDVKTQQPALPQQPATIQTDFQIDVPQQPAAQAAAVQQTPQPESAEAPDFLRDVRTGGSRGKKDPF